MLHGARGHKKDREKEREKEEGRRQPICPIRMLRTDCKSMTPNLGLVRATTKLPTGQKQTDKQTTDNMRHATSGKNSNAS